MSACGYLHAVERHLHVNQHGKIFGNARGTILMREHLEIRTLIPFKLVLYLHENEKYFDGNHGVVLDQVWELGRGEAECGDDLRIFFKLCQQSLLLVQGESVLVKNVQEFKPKQSLS